MHIGKTNKVPIHVQGALQIQYSSKQQQLIFCFGRDYEEWGWVIFRVRAFIGSAWFDTGSSTVEVQDSGSGMWMYTWNEQLVPEYIFCTGIELTDL